MPNEEKQSNSHYPPNAVMLALRELVTLSSHYAELLNMHDGGERRTFASAEEWIDRLIQTKTIPPAAMEKQPTEHFWINGIVAQRDQKPYVQLSNENGLIVQLDSAQVRQIAADMIQMISRTEADAMIVKFFSAHDLPEGAVGAMMMQFRDFRAELDEGGPPRI